MAKDQHKHDDPVQSKRFVEAAREAEAAESKEGADRGFKRIDPHKREDKQRKSRE